MLSLAIAHAVKKIFENELNFAYHFGKGGKITFFSASLTVYFNILPLILHIEKTKTFCSFT